MLNNTTFSSPESAFYEYQMKMENQLCQVCHCLAAGFHHGAYVCEACKKFFKRYSTNQLKSVVVCKKNCDLEKIGRRKCSYCRYKKCLDVGMKFSGVRSTESNIDISQIPCRVCGAKSSGFHFGSLTCEGCKGFFRRAEPVKDKLECVTGNFLCTIDASHKLTCKSCRFRRCVEVGMSKIGSRIGRQPNAVKHHCAIEIINQNTNCSPNTLDLSYQELESVNTDSMLGDCNRCMITSSSSTPTSLDIGRIFSIYLDGNLQAFFFKALEAIQILQKPISETGDSFHISRISVHLNQSLLEVWNSMMRHFDVHTRVLVYFAKKIPGFNNLTLSDKRTMVQDAMYSIMLINLAKSYEDDEEESFNYFDFTKEEYGVILILFPEMKQILAHVIEISRLIYQLKINNLQIGLLCLIELCKNYRNLESINVAKQMYIQVNRLFWISILIELDNETNTPTIIISPKISSLLKLLDCPNDLIQSIISKIPNDLQEQWYEKLHIIFKLLSERLQVFNIEHQSIIDQLKKNRPELPYPELYTEMFQLSTT